MNLQFNKALLDNTSMVFDAFFKPGYLASETTVKVYTDAMNGVNTTTVVPQRLLFVSESFMTIINKINSAFWNGTFDITLDGDKVKILVNTVLNGTESQRNSALSKLVSMGLISEADTTMTRSLASRIPTFDPTLVVKTFDADGKFYKYSYNIPLGLEKKYDVTRNTQGERLYLFFPSKVHSQFGASPVVGETFGYFTKYWNELFQVQSYGMSYAAVDLGDIMSPEEESIKYDHLDAIEYFDNIIIQVKIPNKYN